MTIVLAIIGCLIAILAGEFKGIIYNALNDNFLEPQDNTNFIQVAVNVGEQVEIFEELIGRQLEQQ